MPAGAVKGTKGRARKRVKKQVKKRVKSRIKESRAKERTLVDAGRRPEFKIVQARAGESVHRAVVALPSLGPGSSSSSS